MSLPYGALDDSQLQTLLKIGDRKAFTEIYDRLWEKLYQQGFRILQDRDAAMDVLQEVFVWIWENREHLKIKSFESYLKMAVRYKVANYFRHNKVKIEVHERIKIEREKLLNEEALLELKELRFVIDQFTAQLPKRCGEIFHLSRNEWLTNPEIARKLNVSEKTVENQLTIALKKLKVHLAKNAHLLFLFF